MSVSWILITGLGALLLAPIVWRIADRRFDPFEPVVLFCVAWGVMFVVRPAAMLIDGNLTYSGVNISGTLASALALASMGAVSFLVAYESRSGRALARRLPQPRRIETSRGAVSILVMLALAFLALLAFFKGFSNFHLLLGGRSDQLGRIVHGSSTYLWYGSTLVVPAALVSLALALRERRPVFSLAALAVWAIALFRIVPVGNRIFLLPLLGGAFVYLYVRRGSRPGRTMLVALLASGLLASYAVLLYRYPDSRTGPGTIVTSVFRHPSRPFRSILRGPDAEMAPALAGALTVVPSKLGYRYGGAVLGDLVLRPVPRQLWPGKPETPSQKIVSVAFPSAAPYLNPAFSPLIFLFWDFWIVGVLVGMALFGLLARALYEWFLRFRHDLAAQLVFAVGIWFVVIGARNDPVDTIVISASVLFPLAAVSWLGDRRFRAVPRLVSRPLDVSER